MRLLATGATFLLLFSTACASNTLHTVDEIRQDTFLRSAEPQAEETIAGLANGDYARFTAYFEDEFAAVWTSAYFQVYRRHIHDNLGDLQSHEFRELRAQGDFNHLVYDMSFEKDQNATMHVAFWQDNVLQGIVGVWIESDMLK